MSIRFEDFGLSNELLNALSKKGFEEPSEIQRIVVPELLKERTHLIGQAQTGTGKTAAFGIPILETIDADKSVKALILTPTRELANQVADEIYSLKGEKDIKVLAVYGGASIEQQIKKLKGGVDIVVGTPGRVMDLMKRKILKVDNLDYFVLDEADEMLNMGFIEDIEAILEKTNEEKQMLFFFSLLRLRSINWTYTIACTTFYTYIFIYYVFVIPCRYAVNWTFWLASSTAYASICYKVSHL